jgi:N utilization substance protein B
MSGRGGGSRRRARELALQTLYAIDLGLRRVGRPPLPVRDVDLDEGLDAQRLGEIEAALRASEVQSEAEPAGADDVVPLGPDAAREVFEAIAAHFEAPPGARQAAWELVEAVCANAPLLDERIAARARNWRLSRMAAVDRNILRLGTYELGHTTTPAAVVIDEAVELAHRFGSDPSPSFVNGILDALAADLRPRGTRHAAGDAT